MRALLTACLLYPLFGLAVEEGDIAPSFELRKLIGVDTEHLESYRSKVVYLDFWASWCTPCRVSLPDIIRLKQDLAKEEFEVIAISIDEDPEDARRFIEQYKVEHTILSDTTGTTAANYQIPGMPTSFIIDKEGVIRLRHTGFKAGDMKPIRAQIESLLSSANH